MEAFWGAMIGAVLGVPITALLMAKLFKPHESFKVMRPEPGMLERIKEEPEYVPPESIHELSLDPEIKH